MSKLLINEHPLMVLPRLASKIGLNEALILQQLHYWLLTSSVEKDNKRWVYNTYKDWQEQFPFWSISTIGRIFRSLEEKKLVVTKQFNVSGWDQTKWYTIDYQNDTLDSEETTPSTEPNENTLIKETNKKTNTKKGDLLDGMLAYSGKPDKLHGVPDIHAELMRPFCEFYRYPFKDEVKAWTAQVDVWLSRGYKPQNVVSACKYVSERRDWEYFQPASILKAFGKQDNKTDDLEAKNEELKKLHYT